MLITPGDPESDEVNACGGTSCATPHVGGAAALLWGDVAADGGAGSVAQRVRDRLVAQALDVGAPGADYVFGAGRLRLDLAAPVLGTPTPAPNSLVRGIVSLSLPLAEAGTLGLQQLSVDGQPLVATLAPGGLLQATWPTAGLAPGPHVITLVSSDQSGNVATYTITLRVDNAPPKVRLRTPARARARAKVHVSASVLDVGSGLVAPAAHHVRRRLQGERLPPRAPLQAPRPLHRHDPLQRPRRQQRHGAADGPRSCRRWRSRSRDRE